MTRYAIAHTYRPDNITKIDFIKADSLQSAAMWLVQELTGDTPEDLESTDLEDIEMMFLDEYNTIMTITAIPEEL